MQRRPWNNLHVSPGQRPASTAGGPIGFNLEAFGRGLTLSKWGCLVGGWTKPIWEIMSQILDQFPQIVDENRKSLKPSPRCCVFFFQAVKSSRGNVLGGNVWVIYSSWRIEETNLEKNKTLLLDISSWTIVCVSNSLGSSVLTSTRCIRAKLGAA